MNRHLPLPGESAGDDFVKRRSRGCGRFSHTMRKGVNHEQWCFPFARAGTARTRGSWPRLGRRWIRARTVRSSVGPQPGGDVPDQQGADHRYRHHPAAALDQRHDRQRPDPLFRRDVEHHAGSPSGPERGVRRQAAHRACHGRLSGSHLQRRCEQQQRRCHVRH